MNNVIIKNDVKIENMIYEIRGKQVMLDSDLAKLYNVDVEKARLAALLHDCAKEMPLKEMQDLVKENNYKADEELLANGNLLHGLAGMIRAKL